MVNNKRTIFKYSALIFMLICCMMGLMACKSNNNPKSYSVSFMVDGSLYHSATTDWNNATSFPQNPTKLGYNFDGWYDGENKISEIKKGYKENITLTAKWNIINYSITYELNGGVNNVNNPNKFTIESDNIALSKPEKYGYKFLGWYNGKTNITEIKQGTHENLTLTAKWEIDTESTNFVFDLENGYVITGLKDDSVTSIIIPDYVTEIAGYSFITNSNLEKVEFAENSQCTTIGTYAFEYCDNFKSIKIPKSVKTLESLAFYMCTSLKDVSFENSSCLEVIGDGAFSDCYALENIEIPKTVKTLGMGALMGCTSLKEVTFEKGIELETIEMSTFTSCSSLTKINLPASVTSIGDSAFMSCTALEEVTFESGSKLNAFGENCFTQCTSLKSIEIPESVVSIGTSTNYTLLEVFYGGNEDGVNNISGFNNFLQSNSTIYYYSNIKPETEGNFWHYVNGVITKW